MTRDQRPNVYRWQRRPFLSIKSLCNSLALIGYKGCSQQLSRVRFEGLGLRRADFRRNPELGSQLSRQQRFATNRARCALIAAVSAEHRIGRSAIAAKPGC